MIIPLLVLTYAQRRNGGSIGWLAMIRGESITMFFIDDPSMIVVS